VRQDSSVRRSGADHCQSDPYGSDGFFADLFQRAQHGELEDAVAQHATSAEMNPTLAADFLAAEALSNPEIGAQLFISPPTVQYHRCSEHD
jgi:hypothetical protein